MRIVSQILSNLKKRGRLRGGLLLEFFPPVAADRLGQGLAVRLLGRPVGLGQLEFRNKRTKLHCASLLIPLYPYADETC